MEEMDMYKVVNGTSYRKETPDKVVEILERARQNKTRIRVFYGDVKTGRDWLDEYGTIGTVGRSSGRIAIPLLIRSIRGFGGISILDDSIVKITIDKRVVYQIENYQEPDFKLVDESAGSYTGFAVVTAIDDKLKLDIARFYTKEKAQRFIDFMLGLRNAK